MNYKVWVFTSVRFCCIQTGSIKLPVPTHKTSRGQENAVYHFNHLNGIIFYSLFGLVLFFVETVQFILLKNQPGFL